MEYVIDQDKAFVRLQKGQSLFPSLVEIAQTENWRAAHISGLGALSHLELGYYDLPTKTYLRKQFNDEYELLSMDGNLSMKDGEPFFHLHGVFSGRDFQAFGGHMFKAEVAVTCEVNIRLFSAEIERRPDSEVGLSLVHFCKI
jgi:predicted DNA-binding protein with PD1-like motif